MQPTRLDYSRLANLAPVQYSTRLVPDLVRTNFLLTKLLTTAYYQWLERGGHTTPCTALSGFGMQCVADTVCLCAGVSLPVVDEEDMQPLGADQLFDASQCAQLLTHTTTVEKTQRPSTR